MGNHGHGEPANTDRRDDLVRTCRAHFPWSGGLGGLRLLTVDRASRVRVVAVGGTDRVRYRVLVLSAEEPRPEAPGGELQTASKAAHESDGWELVRSGVTKDGISRLLVYRESA